MGITFSSLKSCCGYYTDSDSDNESDEEINKLQFEESKKSLKYFMIYRQCR